jgi:hypothetical protein
MSDRTNRRTTGLDRRDVEVRQTIAAIHAMHSALDCDRTPRTAEYRICFRMGGTAICQYAQTASQAIAIAKQLVALHG